MKTVLVVDDEFDLANTLCAVLAAEGYHAETCSDGREAMERLRAGPKPDLVLMDIMMPRASGLDVLRSMRQSEALADVPVVLMSVIPPPAKQADYGWQSFLHKPFTLQSVLHAVREHLGEPAAAPK